MMEPSKFWAAAPIEQLASDVMSKFEEYKKWMDTTGYAARIRAAYQTYYGFNDKGSISIKRDDKKISRINVNHYRSLIRRIHIIVTENKLAYQARANNSDSKSQIEADLARGICEYYADEKKMNDVLSKAVLGSLIMLEQYIHTPWDLYEGYELSVDGDRVVKSGDQSFQIFSPFDVARNTSDAKSNWYIVREKCNKYDAAALYPDFAEEILSDSMRRDSIDLNMTQYIFQSNNLTQIDDNDMVYKYHLYHARTPAMEQGRHAIICADQVLFDGPLMYDKIPVHRLQAGSVLETSFADSPAIDLLPLQEGLNALFSAVTTNGLNNAIQMIHSPDPNLTVRDLSDGQRVVTSTQPPTALNLSGSSADTYRLIDMFVSHQQLISGISESVRGAPGANLKSGTSIALVLAQAIQYVSEIQKNYAQVAGDVATSLINNVQKFGNSEMIAYITGVNRKGSIKKFKAQDIMDVERISVDLGPPITQTIAGRHELIQAWMQYGVIKDPKQIVSFLRTGELDQTTESIFSDTLLIREENEQIKRGEKPVVLMLDNHQEHILEHKTIFSSPEARNDPRITNAGLAHIQEHIEFMRSTPPDLAAVITGQPLPQPEAAAPPEADQPEVNGVGLPNVPPGTPPQVADNYQEAIGGLPPQQGEPIQ